MNLTINSKFRPFTYDEMVKPLVQYKEVYDKLEQDYSDLAAQTEILKDIAERTGDTSTYNKYNTYYNDLNAAIDDFSKGMNMSNRSALLKLQRRYHSDIEPISKASKRIEELSNEQRKLEAANPDIMFDRDFSTDVTVDQMINNPNLSYKTINGDAIYKKGAEISKAMASRKHSMQLDPELKDQYWKIREGFSEEEANKFLLDSGAFPELNQALNDLVESTGAPDNLKDRVYNYAKQGAISGMVGKTSYQANRNYESDADRSTRMQAATRAAKADGSAPYVVDKLTGKEYYVNTSANITWSKDKDGNITFGDRPKGGGGRGNKPPLTKEEIIEEAKPEEIDGQLTGRGWSPSLKKWIDMRTGNITRQGGVTVGKDATGSPKVEAYKIKPMFFDAWSSHGNIWFQPKDENDQSSDKGEIKPFDFHALHEKPRQAIVQYIHNLLGTERLTEESINKIVKILEITRDWDSLSDNHFAVRIPGVGDDGSIEDKEVFKSASEALNKIVAADKFNNSSEQETKERSDQSSRSEDDIIPVRANK